MKVDFYKHAVDEKDIANVVDVLGSIFLTTGNVTAQFENDFSNLTGLAHTVGLTSCTAALHLALLANDIGPGDEVITTAMTFIATATSVLHAGATPVLVDVEPDSGLIDIEAVEKAITPKTRAVIPVHLYGTMVDMVALRKLADQYNLVIIEDCAHCIEAERDGISPGQLGDCACYSFYATKNLTCGEGGALSTNNKVLADKVRMLRLHGMSKDASTRYSGKYEHWDMLSLGWKYNMFDIQAALLIDQLKRLNKLHSQRQQICQRYTEALNDMPGLELPASHGKSAFHLYTIWVAAENRDHILHKLQAAGVGVAVNYRAIHNLSFFKNNFGFSSDSFPIAHGIGQKTISLPLYPGLPEDDQQYVIQQLINIINTP